MRSEALFVMFALFALFALLVEGVFGHTHAVKSVTVMEGDSVNLSINVSKKNHEPVLWYFGDIRIALINGEPSTSCLYYGVGGMFRDRLEVDYKTGSLIITNIRPEHTGPYEAEIIRSTSTGKSQSLNRNSKCDGTKIINKTSEDIIKSFNLTVNASDSGKNKNDGQIEPQDKEKKTSSGLSSDVSGSGLSSGAVAGICVGVLLLVAAAVGVMIFRCRSSRKDKGKNNRVLEQVSNDKTQNESLLMV